MEAYFQLELRPFLECVCVCAVEAISFQGRVVTYNIYLYTNLFIFFFLFKENIIICYTYVCTCVCSLICIIKHK